MLSVHPSANPKILLITCNVPLAHQLAVHYAVHVALSHQLVVAVPHIPQHERHVSAFEYADLVPDLANAVRHAPETAPSGDAEVPSGPVLSDCGAKIPRVEVVLVE